MGFIKRLLGRGKGGDKARNRAIQAWDGLEVPTVNAREIRAKGPIYTANLSSRAADAYANPGDVAAQQKAAQNLYNVYEQGGYTDAERAQLDQGRQQISRQAASQRDAAMAQARRRGVGGSGAELAAALGAGDAARIQGGQFATDVAASGMQRALAALSGYGDLSTTMRSQGFDERFRTGSAADEMKRFNEAARQNASERAVARAQMADVSNSTLDQRNAQNIFNNEMALRGAKSGTNLQAANQAASQQASSSNSILNWAKFLADMTGGEGQR